MKRNRIIAAIAIVAVVIIAGAIIFAGCQNKAPKADYYPLGVGSYWEYNVVSYLDNGVTKLGKEIVFVTSKEKVGSIESYVVDRFTVEGQVPGIGQYREYLVKTDKGVECTKRAFPTLLQLQAMFPGLQWGIDNTPPEERFRNNLKEGDSWKWEGIVSLLPIVEQQGSTSSSAPQKPPKIESIKGTMEYKYLGHEKINVLGKEYDCIKISVFGKSVKNQEISSMVWFAPGIGRVREEQSFFEGAKNIRSIFEITSYNLTNRELFKAK